MSLCLNLMWKPLEERIIGDGNSIHVATLYLVHVYTNVHVGYKYIVD